jgi:hypothetical protein
MVVLLSTLAGTSWRIALNIGRERGTWMPEEWAASGARLVLPVDVRFDTEPATEEHEPLIGEQDGTCRLRALGPAKFVGATGEVEVPALDGCWRATESGRGGEVFLRFFLDFPKEAVRNDVVFPSGRVFFTNGLWDAEQLALCEEAVAQLQQQVDEIDQQQKASEAKVAADGGLLTRAGALREGARRYEERDLLLAKLRAVVVSLPGPSGTVDGPSGLAVGKRGGLSVKRRGPWYRGFGDEYHMLGTFSMAPLEAEDNSRQRVAADGDVES